MPPYPELTAAQNQIYRVCGFAYSLPQPEPESADYAAHTFVLNGARVCFRAAKITPTKIGQFVTVWKRICKGPIQPFDALDAVDFYVINVRCGRHFGQFVFPKAALRAYGVLSVNGIGGKRALRVYPPWDTPNNQQANKTQAWQLPYFLDASEGTMVDAVLARKLYC